MTTTVLAAAQALLATLANPATQVAIEEANAEAMTTLQAAGALAEMRCAPSTPLQAALVDAVVSAKAVPLYQLHTFLRVRARLAEIVAGQLEVDASSNEGELIALCEEAGVRFIMAEEAEVAGKWDWRHDSGSCDYSHDSKAEAARDALDYVFGEDWRTAVANQDTKRGFVEWVREEGLELIARAG